jgi:hypothetical protein
MGACYSGTGTDTMTLNIDGGDALWLRAREWLKGLRYQPEPLRPPWELGVASYGNATSGVNGWPGPGYWLTVLAHCADSTGERGPLPLKHYRPLPLELLDTRDRFRRHVLRLICEVHAHEAMECLLDENGERVVSPHPRPYEVLYRVPAEGDTLVSWSVTSALGSTT